MAFSDNDLSGLTQNVFQTNDESAVPEYVHVVWGKNNLGGLKHRTVRRKQVKHYANETSPERCLVNLLKKYMRKCPKSAIEKDVFYLAPRRKYELSDEVWYTANPVGKTTLGLTVKKLCEAAGIKGHYTNHSLRATTATRGLAKGIPEKFVMERTGHRDIRSLQKYQRPEVSTKLKISTLTKNQAFWKKINSREV